MGAVGGKRGEMGIPEAMEALDQTGQSKRAAAEALAAMPQGQVGSVGQWYGMALRCKRVGQLTRQERQSRVGASHRYKAISPRWEELAEELAEGVHPALLLEALEAPEVHQSFWLRLRLCSLRPLRLTCGGQTEVEGQRLVVEDRGAGVAGVAAAGCC